MKRIFAALLSLAMLASLIPAAFAAGTEKTTAKGDAALSLACASAILIDQETGTILYEKDAHQQLEPASVTKVMTLLLVMEAVDSGQLPLDSMITVSAYAAGMGGSQVYLKQGEQMSADEMIKCVAVVSGNDCAVALAEQLAGSESAFVAQMNARAKQLGMENTNFVNCTGLPAKGHVTTAYDISLMSRELLKNHPDIQRYTTIWMDTIRNGEFGLTNTNRLVRFYEGTTGLKTGSTDAARYCMAASAQRDGLDLIAVVMKAPTTAERFDDAKTLLDYGFANYAMLTVYPDTALAPVEVLLGTSGQIQPVLEHECKLLLEKSQAGAVTTRVKLAQDIEAPVEQGQIVGQMEVYVNDTLRESVPIISSEHVARVSTSNLFFSLLRSLMMAQ